MNKKERKINRQMKEKRLARLTCVSPATLSVERVVVGPRLKCATVY